MKTQCCFMPLHLGFKQIFFYYLDSVKKTAFNMFHIFMADSLYTTLKLIPYRKIFPTIYKMPGPVSIDF